MWSIKTMIPQLSWQSVRLTRARPRDRAPVESLIFLPSSPVCHSGPPSHQNVVANPLHCVEVPLEFLKLLIRSLQWLNKISSVSQTKQCQKRFFLFIKLNYDDLQIDFACNQTCQHPVCLTTYFSNLTDSKNSFIKCSLR